MSKANAKGRRSNSPFVGVRRDIFESPAWRTLTADARCIYLEILARFWMNPKKGLNNNGEIPLSVREAAEVFHGKTDTAMKRLNELVAHGLIRANNKGHFGNLHATTWILTHESFGNHPPTNEWRNFRSEK